MLNKLTLMELKEFIYEKTRVNGCDHDHTYTREFLKTRNIDTESVIAWLESKHGYCDCEVMYNVD